MVVVPHAAGPVLDRDHVAGRRAPDELNELLDELLPVGDARAGAFDLAALSGGAGLLSWAALGGPGWASTVGVAAVGFGAILPIRALLGRLSSARDVRRRRGTPLDTSHTEVRRLLDLHDDVMAAAVDGLSEVALATHLALVEVATLLDGAPATHADEVRFVADRADAVHAAVARSGLDGDGGRRAARLAALVELDEFDRHSSLQRLQQLSGDH
jgi:hypothetical protein